MGTDIDMFAEIRRESQSHIYWEYHQPSPEAMSKLNITDYGEPLIPVFNNRNSSTFNLLAGVCQHRIEGRHEAIPPVSELRGLPIDVSPEISKYFFDDGSGGVEEDPPDASWLLLSELLNYDWEKPVSCWQGDGTVYHRPRKDFSDRIYPTVIPYLRTLGKPEDVRVVFWFC